MPVYNGEAMIEEAIESILAQSFEDLELIISDNASTDATENICRALQGKDERFRYVRNDTNLGVLVNFNQVAVLSGGEYFKWAAYDDLCGRDFLLRCVDALDNDPSAVLASSRIAWIDENGNRVARLVKPGPGQPAVNMDVAARIASSAMSSVDPVARFKKMMRDLWWTPELYGLMRRETLARTGLHAHHYMGDHIFLSELALHGRFLEIPEELLFIRVHPGQTSSSSRARDRVALVETGGKPRRLPLWLRAVGTYVTRFRGHAEGISKAPIRRFHRFRCYMVLVTATARWALARLGSFVSRIHRTHNRVGSGLLPVCFPRETQDVAGAGYLSEVLRAAQELSL